MSQHFYGMITNFSFQYKNYLLSRVPSSKLLAVMLPCDAEQTRHLYWSSPLGSSERFMNIVSLSVYQSGRSFMQNNN